MKPGKNFPVWTLLLMLSAGGLLFPNGIQPLRWQLSNGIEVIYARHPRPGNTIINLFLRGGQRLEPPGKEGLAYLTTRLLNELHSSEQIRELRELGGRFRLNSFWEFSVLSAATLSRNLEPSMAIFADLLRNPIFSSTRLDFIRRNTRGLRIRQLDDPRQQIALSFKEALCGRPAGTGSILGTEEGLQNIRLRDLKTLYRQYLSPDNLLMTVSSDLSSTEVRPVLEKHFSAVSGRGRPALSPPPSPSPFPSRSRSIPRELNQTYLSMGFLLPSPSPEHFLLAQLLSTRLGRGVGSLLWSLRSRDHLTYSIQSEVRYFSHGGVLTVTIAVSPEREEEARTRLLEIIDRLRTGGINGPQLSGCKRNLQLQLRLSAEEKMDVAHMLGYYVLLGLGADFIDRFADELDKIPLGDFNDFARRILAEDRRMQLTVGPKDLPCQSPGR